MQKVIKDWLMPDRLDRQIKVVEKRIATLVRQKTELEVLMIQFLDWTEAESNADCYDELLEEMGKAIAFDAGLLLELRARKQELPGG